MRPLVLTILLIVGSVGMLAEPALRPAGAGVPGFAVSIVPAQLGVTPDARFDVEVVLDQGSEIPGVSATSLTLSFDPNVLRVTNIVASNARLPFLEQPVFGDGSTASLVLGAATCEAAQQLPQQLTVAKLTMQAIGAAGSRSAIAVSEAIALAPITCGISNVQSQDWTGISENLVERTSNATICVNAEQAPCPVVAATPHIRLSPERGRAGQVVNVTVAGFQPAEGISVQWEEGRIKRKKGKKKHSQRNGQMSPVGSAVASQDGSATLSFTVPRKQRGGQHAVVASGTSGSSVSAQFSVAAAKSHASRKPAKKDDRRHHSRQR